MFLAGSTPMHNSFFPNHLFSIGPGVTMCPILTNKQLLAKIPGKIFKRNDWVGMFLWTF